MKNFAILTIVLAMGMSTAQAGRVKDLSGTVENNVYKDKQCGFSLTLNDDWKYTLRKNEEKFRILLTQRNYEIPPGYISAPDYTLIPRIVLWSDTTSLNTFGFLDSLVSITWQSEQKKEILKEFEILSNIPASGSKMESAIPRGRKPVEIGGEQGILWQAKAKYVKEIETSAGAVAVTVVNGAFGAAIVAVKHGDRIIVFHLMTEWDFFDAILGQALKIIGSLDFGNTTKTSKAQETGG